MTQAPNAPTDKPRKRKLRSYIMRCEDCGKKETRKMGGACSHCGGYMQGYERIEP